MSEPDDLWFDDEDLEDLAEEDELSLTPLREQIDTVDAQMVALLGQRFALTREVGQIKAEMGLPGRDDVRESHQRLRLALLSEEQGIDAPTVLRIFDTITNRVVEEHEDVKKAMV
ncbi:MAG: chorismate mutase [Propionibacteriaceae bacterium]|nr:chorismate mutase [Propionibacteriaceae bacterium]